MKTPRRIVWDIAFPGRSTAERRERMASLAYEFVSNQYPFRYSERAGGSFAASCSVRDAFHFTEIVSVNGGTATQRKAPF